jgi:hypothetical protein
MIARIDAMLALYETGAIDRRQFVSGVIAAAARPRTSSLTSVRSFASLRAGVRGLGDSLTNVRESRPLTRARSAA